MQALEQSIEEIVGRARSGGLDFFEMRYELCPAHIIYTFGAYGMPGRFSHWSFGKAYYALKSQYDYGLSKIYELVINSDPCYAFLLESNTLLQNKLIAAHVLAHSDFFKNNWRFAGTNRRMLASMAAFAERVRDYEQTHGRPAVEAVLDAALALSPQIDPSGRPELTQDLLAFLAARSSALAPWQQDIVASVGREAHYLRPQLETKILNEGWASFWHARLLRELPLTATEAVDFARLHAQVLAPHPYQINPYHLGYHLLVDLERRHGTDYLFEVRATETDVSLLRNHLTRELVEELGLYLYKKVADRFTVTAASHEWQRVRDGISRLFENGGAPYIAVADDNYQGRGELLLSHRFEGVELDRRHLTKTLPHLHLLWGRPVHLETVEEGVAARYSYDGADVSRLTL